ncbi:uncharacterized protein ACWYII_017494 [Salvelinus alpinus]
MTENKTKSCQLMTQISIQFEEMHHFLKKREEEIKKKEFQEKEREALENMRGKFSSGQHCWEIEVGRRSWELNIIVDAAMVGYIMVLYSSTKCLV